MMNARVTLASILSSVHQLEGQISDLPQTSLIYVPLFELDVWSHQRVSSVAIDVGVESYAAPPTLASDY